MSESSQVVSAERQDEWVRLEVRHRQALREAKCEQALLISTLDDLKVYIRHGAQNLTGRNTSQIYERLDPHITHLNSFTKAITSASQYSPVACLVWGGLQAIVESADITGQITDEALEIFEGVQRAVPLFDGYLALFPSNTELHWMLQDILSSFLEYCVVAAEYFRTAYTRKYLLQFFTSASPTKLQNLKKQLGKHIGEFEKLAALAHREEVRTQQLLIKRHLGPELTQIPRSYRNMSVTAAHRVEYPVTTVTMYRNFTFTGRQDVIDDIEALFEGSKAEKESPAAQARAEAQNFCADSKSPAVVVLSGLGGIGKTQVALEYTYRKKGKYDAIFWLQAEHDWTLASTFEAIAKSLRLLEDDSPDLKEDQLQSLAVQKACEWLNTTDQEWLLVFDNVEDLNDLSAYLPKSTRGRGDIILTTQKDISFRHADRFKFIRINPFTRDDAAALLFEYLQRRPVSEREEDVSRELCDMVDGLPLAISTIGGYIYQSGSNPEEFINTLKYSANSWTASAVGPANQYEKSLQTVFDIALKELSDSAAGLAGILAFLNPDHIPEIIFEKAIEKGTLKFLRNKADLLEAVRELKVRQLVRRDTVGADPYLCIHRTVQWNILLHLSKDKGHRWKVFEQAFRVIRDVLPAESPFASPSPDKWPKFQKYGPHVLSLRAHCLWPDPPIPLPINFAQVVSDMGTFMWHAGKLNEGEEALQTAVDIMNQENVQDQNLRANVFEMMGIMSSFEGVSERERSMTLRHSAREARHQAYNDMPQRRITKNDEIHAMLVESDMAYAYVQQEDFDEAAVIMEEVVKHYKEWGTEDEIPYQYSQYYQLMSVCHMAAANPGRSIKCITRCTELLVKAGDAMHPMTQLMRFIAGYLTWHAGQKEKALEINESVLEARKKVIGEFSHFTLESYSTTAYLLAKMGQYQKARVYLDRCLERRKRALWNEEGVARAQYRYSEVLEKLGEHEEAKRMAAMAQEAREKALDKYPRYLPKNGTAEEIHDQMVSVWAGRFTGKLVQKVADIPKIEDLDVEGPELGKTQETIDENPQFPEPEQKELGVPKSPETVAEVVDVLDPH